MAIVYLVKTGAIIHANEVALLKIEKVNKGSVTVSRLNQTPKTFSVIELGNVMLDNDVGADIMLTKIYSSGPNGSVKLSCGTQLNRTEIRYSVNENNYQPRRGLL